ncbi:hypothetical protein F53441_4077 [Fusarium austroafricanum]|uniref:2EXR domain-containing protein n=1 Tax=Fusarium austroafricanum TaxID=2364996 RepID=A0A8H4KPJ0_9HYPO|nr:hypothetical protein F53441_4077 [Fusarium austroafricanum]
MNESFPQFIKLPPEVRAAIWELTFPDDVGTLYIFNINWWARHYPPGASSHDLSAEGIAQLSRPPRVQVPTPVCAGVCREAKQVVKLWRKKLNLEWYYREETKGNILVRPFDEERDILYVPRNKWESFQDLIEQWEGDNAEFRARTKRIMASVKHLALPAFTAYYSIKTLAHLLPWMINIKTIYVVWNALPKVRMIQKPFPGFEGVMAHITAPVQPRWDIDTFPKLEDTVRLHQPDEDTGRDFIEEDQLQEWVCDMEDLLMTTEVDPKIWDEDEEKLKTPQIHVTVKEVPTWF